MTTEQASKLKRGTVVALFNRRITVENVQIALSTMAVILTTADGEELRCKASELALV